jgi:hypothetical protein
MRASVAIGLGLVLLICLPTFAAERMVVVEGFSNVSCPYCSDIKPYMQQILTVEYEGLIVPLEYHTWWPSGSDTFYTFNEAGNEARIYYYAGYEPWIEYLYVPSFRFDGKYIKDPSDVADTTAWNSFVRATLDSLLLIPSPIRIDVEYNQFAPDSDSVFVSFDVVAEDSADYNMKLFLVVNEWRHRAFPHGAFDHVMRELLPDNDGYDLGPMVPGDSLHFEWSYAIDPEYWVDRVVTSIFIQRNGTRKMQQGWRGMPVPDPLAGIEVTDLPGVRLGRNMPNPFSTETTISYNVRSSGRVRLDVFTLTGQLVTTLVDENVGAGSHQVVWDGRDAGGRAVASGVYYYRVHAGDDLAAGKMILLR